MVEIETKLQTNILTRTVLRAEKLLNPINPFWTVEDTRRVNIPPDILSFARQRNIVAKEPYFINQEGEYVDKNGRSIRERWDPKRIKKEYEMTVKYIDGLSIDQKEFIEDVLADPNSDTKVDNVHRAGVQRFNASRFKPMTLDCRAAVIIPARFEQKNIKCVLNGYANQKDVFPDQFEINVIVNHRIDEKPDQTTEVVLQFMREHPEIKVNLLDVQFEKEHANVGRARKIITDFVVARSLSRKEYSPLYIITEDADVNKVDPVMLKRVIEKFDANPQLDCLRGRQDRSSALIAQNYLYALTYKANQIAETILRDKRLQNPYREGYNFDWNRVVSGGWASAFTSEAYVLIGGYPADTTVGEDVIIGQLCSIARGHLEGGVVVPFINICSTISVKGESNYLRLGNEVITGLSAYSPDQFNNQDIKKRGELELLEALRQYSRIDPQNPQNVKRFEKAVRGAFYFMLGCVGNKEAFFNIYSSRYMLFLGFKDKDYKIIWTKNGDIDGHIDLEIINWDNVIGYLDINREKYEAEFKSQYLNGLKGGDN